MSQRNVEEDELLDALWGLVEEWRGIRASYLDGTKHEPDMSLAMFRLKLCADDLERVLKEAGDE